jgi:hypothetical protein
MKWLLTGCAVVALSGGAAFAGPCAQQITALQKSLSSRDAGAGPTRTQADNGPSSQISEAGTSVRGTSEASRGAAEVRAKGGQGGGSERVGPTETMGQATGGSAASAQDVRLQQQGRPTQAEAARNGAPTGARAEDRLQKVTADLDRARRLDAKNDSACTAAVEDARKDMATD